jgi:hypothetical protein
MSKCIKCGSYAFNLYKEDIDQGGLCDVHYWQGRAHRAEAKQEQGEPVAWMVYAKGSRRYFTLTFDLNKVPEIYIGGEAVPLYTTPPQRPSRSDIKPLTEEQLIDLWPSLIMHQHTYAFARAIEAAHGITSDTDFKE